MSLFKNRASWLALPVTVIGFLVLYVPFRALWAAEYPPWSRIEIATVRVPLVVVAMSFGWVGLLLPIRLMKWTGALIGFGAWVLMHQFYGALGWGALVYPLILIAGVVIAQRRAMALALRIGLWTFTWILGVSALAWLAGRSGETGAFKMFWVIHPFFAYLAGLQIFADEKSTPMMLLNPASYVVPLPFSSDAGYAATEDERNANWWLGARDVVIAEIGFILLLLLVQQMHKFGAPPDWLMPVWLYVPFLLFVASSMTLVTGIQRTYGIRTRPASDAIWKAKDPAEIWVRSSTHVSEFVLQQVYVPLFRRFRSSGLALFGALLFIVFNAALFHALILKPFVALIFPAVLQDTETLYLVAGSLVWVAVNWILLVFTFKIWRPFLLRRNSAVINVISAVVAHASMALSFWIPFRVLGPSIKALLSRLGGAF